MNKLVISFAALAVFFTTVVQAQAPDLSKLDVVERSLPDGPVAKVDDEFVSKEAFLFLYRQQLAALRMMNPSATIPEGIRVMTGIQVLRELLEREVLAAEADRLGLSVTDAEVEEAYTTELSALQEVLQQQGDAATEADVLRRGGQTREGALRGLRKELKADKVRARIVRDANITVSDGEIEAFYNENTDAFRRSGGLHLKQIFIRPKPDGQQASDAAWNQARETMDHALARIRAGETFEGVAKAMSEAPDAQNGGDMGMIPIGKLPPFYVEAAQRLQPGQLSDVIRSEHGFHVIRLVATQDDATVSIDEARERIEFLIMREKGEVAIGEYAEPLINDVNRVQIFLRLEENLANLENAPRQP